MTVKQDITSDVVSHHMVFLPARVQILMFCVLYLGFFGFKLDSTDGDASVMFGFNLFYLKIKSSSQESLSLLFYSSLSLLV